MQGVWEHGAEYMDGKYGKYYATL